MNHLQENPRTLSRIDKMVSHLHDQMEKDKKGDSKWTPAIARGYGMRIDYKVKSLGKQGLSSTNTNEKLDLILRMLMGLSSGNLMNLAVSKKGGLLAKVVLAKGLVTEDKKEKLSSLFTERIVFGNSPFYSFGDFSLINELYEKMFDGDFDKKTEQDETLEFLQTIGKIVDGRKVVRERITLRNGVYCIIQRPMTSNGTGYILVKVTDDGTDKSKNDEGVTIYEEVPHDREVKTSVIKNFSGPKQLKPSSQISVSPLDCLAVSQDNKRFYLVYDLDEIEPKKMVPFQKNKDEDDEDTPDDGVNENFLFEKSLSNTDIQDLINSIKNKLKSRTDEKARGMLKLAKDIEKTFKEKKSLHPNSVVTIMRMATSVGGKWGVNSKDWNGKPPSGKLNKYPPSPTEYSS